MNDLIYNEIITTSDYKLEFAVGTTYSLDLDAFLAISIAFAKLGEANDLESKSAIRLIEGAQQAGKKIAIFCNKLGIKSPLRGEGKVKIPYQILDKSVFEVEGGSEGSFHPKIWVIKEHHEKNLNDKQIKLIVMSRNLTKSADLDVAATMVAKYQEKHAPKYQKKHEPLRAFLMKLAEITKDENKKKQIKDLADDVVGLDEFTCEPPFDGYDFFPIWFGENLNKDEAYSVLPGQDMIVVSPFIDETTLEHLNKSDTGRKVLITRKESLTANIMELYDEENREIWVPSPAMSNAEQNNIQAIDLHAKMYFSQNGDRTLWIGSANATERGFHNNTEFLLRLTYKRGKKQYEDFKDIFCKEKKFQKIDTFPDLVSSEEESIRRARKEIEDDLRKFLSNDNLQAKIVNVRNNEYDVVISFRDWRKIAGTIEIAPIQDPKSKIKLSADKKRYTVHIQIAQLSEFYILSVLPNDKKIGKIEMTIKIPTKGMPKDRDDAVINEIIPDEDTLLDYIEMMITNRPHTLATRILQSMEYTGKTGGRTKSKHRSNAIYESLLKMMVTDKEKIEEMNETVNRIKTKSKSLEQMMEKMKNVIKK